MAERRDRAQARRILVDVVALVSALPPLTALTRMNDADRVILTVRTRRGYHSAEVYGYSFGEVPPDFEAAYLSLLSAQPSSGTLLERFPGDDAIHDVLSCPQADHAIR